jgi:signal transduction histidine kinase
MTPNRTLPPATAAARIAPLLLQLAALAIAAGGLWLWRHRQQIGEALVAAVATSAAAGAWGRQQIEALAADSARRLPSQPIAALAPITATLAAAWGLVDRATMARGHRAQRARMADIASAYNMELHELQRPINRRYSSAAAARVIFSDGRELSPYLWPLRFA